MEILRNLQMLPILFGVMSVMQIPTTAMPSDSSPAAIDSLMPTPQTVVLHPDEPFRIEAGFTVQLVGNYHPRLESAATRFLRRLDRRTGLFFTQSYPVVDNRESLVGLLVRVDAPGTVELGMDESYTLEVNEEQVILTAATDIGALRGLETLQQMLDADANGYVWQACRVEDAPRFPWRGLMIDSCRHFMPLDMLKRNLDGMASVKLNVLHWHLTEDQGFRIESKTFPKLHEMGSDGQYYTHAQIREIVEYADARGIRVVPEFDIPGHATAWLVGYPELGSAPGPYQIERQWGIFDPCLNPANPEVYVFLEKLFDEMTALFPDAYFHIGGDEVNGVHWDANAQIQQFMQENGIADNHALQSYFNQKVLEILTADGKKMIGWDEILQPDMPTDVMIQSWRGRESMEAAARGGYASILSNGYYIDLIYPAVDHYLNDPLPEDTNLTEAEQARILGGEATMWAEYVTDETVDSRIWPRTAAIAERLWSDGSVRDVESMYERLDHQSLLLEELGLRHLINREAMMRRLSGSREIEAIRILCDAIEPLKGYRRYTYRTQTQLTPYTLLVDIARPDAPDARRFNAWVKHYLELGDSSQLPHISALLDQWVNNESAFHSLAAHAPVLHEGNVIATQLRELSVLARASIAVIEGEEADLGAKWSEGAGPLLESARRPMAATEIQIVDAVEKLYKAAIAR